MKAKLGERDFCEDALCVHIFNVSCVGIRQTPIKIIEYGILILFTV